MTGLGRGDAQVAAYVRQIRGEERIEMLVVLKEVDETRLDDAAANDRGGIGRCSGIVMNPDRISQLGIDFPSVAS